MLIDSHCHLDLLAATAPEYTPDAVIAEAHSLGVTAMLCVSVTLEAFPAMLALVERLDGVYASVGVHPNEREGSDPSIEELVRLANSSPRIVAIGETGLDYFRSEGDLEWQRQRFRRHIQAARATGLPLIIHTRDADEDTLRILREEKADEVGGVLHCFTGTEATARAALELGFYVSFSGIVTFASAKELRHVATVLPEDRILVETDSPWLKQYVRLGRGGSARLQFDCLLCVAGIHDVHVSPRYLIVQLPGDTSRAGRHPHYLSGS